VIDRQSLAVAVQDQLSMTQETGCNYKAILSSAGFVDIPEQVQDLLKLATVLHEQGSELGPEGALAVGLAHGVAIGARAQRNSEPSSD
jgi:hypothetical protein